MVPNTIPLDSEVAVFQKSQVSCQGLSLQKNSVFTRFTMFHHVFLLGYNVQALEHSLPFSADNFVDSVGGVDNIDAVDGVGGVDGVGNTESKHKKRN